MISGIPSISGITYSPNDLSQPNNFLHYFNEALAAGYEPTEARRIAKIKLKEQREKDKKKSGSYKERKVEDTSNSNHIDRRG